MKTKEKEGKSCMESVRSIANLVTRNSDTIEDGVAVIVAFEIADFVLRSQHVPELKSLVVFRMEQLKFLYGNRAMVRINQLVEPTNKER